MSPELVSERQLVRKAVTDSSARLELKEKLRPYSVKETRRFMERWQVPSERKNELLEVAMSPFDRVFNIYLKNLQDHNNHEGHFYKYYNWWVRKAISEHLPALHPRKRQ